MRRRRRVWIILLATPLMLVTADTLYWWIAVNNLEHGFAAWQAERPGRRLERTAWYRRHEVAGLWQQRLWFRRCRSHAAAPTFRADWHGVWTGWCCASRWHGRDGWRSRPRAGNGFDWPGTADVPVTADRLRLVLPLGAERWPGFADITADNLHADTPLGGDASVGSLRLHLDFRPQAQSGEPAVEFSLQAEAISPPSGIARPLGPRIANLEMEGALNGPVPAGRTLAEQAAAWRDGGGSLEIRRLALVWGPLI